MNCSVNAWINSVLYESAYTISDIDSDDSVCIVYSIKQSNNYKNYEINYEVLVGWNPTNATRNNVGMKPQLFVHV